MRTAGFISTGGVGDAFIAALKLQEWSRFTPDVKIDWIHVESSDIGKAFISIIDLVPKMRSYIERAEFIHDENYIQNFLDGKWKGRRSIPISFNRECRLHQQKWTIDDPYLDVPKISSSRYDICLQVSAGQKNNKQWNFNILSVADLLARNYDYRVCLIGNDDRFKPDLYVRTGCEYKDERVSNQVCRYENLSLAVQPIWESKVFIGLSGFMNYFACACGIPNAHLIEGPDQELDYYHEKWKDLTYGIKYPTIHELMRGINHFRMTGVL